METRRSDEWNFRIRSSHSGRHIISAEQFIERIIFSLRIERWILLCDARFTKHEMSCIALHITHIHFAEIE